MGKIFRKRGTKQNDILVFKAYFQVRVYTIVFLKKIWIDHFSRWNMVSDSLMGVFGKHSGSAARSYRSCTESRAGSLLDLKKYTLKH